MDFDNAEELSRHLYEETTDPVSPILARGQKVGPWEVLAYLGGGGSGEVYRVRHDLLCVVRAMKMLKSVDASAQVRFMREATFLARQTARGFPRFYELGKHGEKPYYIMEMLESRDLPRGDRAVGDYLCRLCAIVSDLHHDGFVHRDIKPSNVLFRENGELVLSDFGLVKPIAAERARDSLCEEITKYDRAAGTFGYAAPEQLVGAPVNAAADTHSLGVLANVCFEGRPPWRWRRIIQRATSSIPARRYSSANQMVADIRHRFLPEWILVLSGVLMMLAVVGLLNSAGIGEAEASEPMSATKPAERIPTEGKAAVQNASDSAADWL